MRRRKDSCGVSPCHCKGAYLLARTGVAAAADADACDDMARLVTVFFKKKLGPHAIMLAAHGYRYAAEPGKERSAIPENPLEVLF